MKPGAGLGFHVFSCVLGIGTHHLHLGYPSLHHWMRTAREETCVVCKPYVVSFLLNKSHLKWRVCVMLVWIVWFLQTQRNGVKRPSKHSWSVLGNWTAFDFELHTSKWKPCCTFYLRLVMRWLRVRPGGACTGFPVCPADSRRPMRPLPPWCSPILG